MRQKETGSGDADVRGVQVFGWRKDMGAHMATESTVVFQPQAKPVNTKAQKHADLTTVPVLEGLPPSE